LTRISVVIPTHNRPELLLEAVESIARQSYPAFEIIVVDDGSQPPVDAESLRKDFGSRIRVIRNEQPMKLTYARNQGVQAARGEVVTQLDDDDILAPEALEMGLAALEGNRSLQIVFLGVKGFGERAEHFDRSQERAMQGVLEHAKGQESKAGIVQFGPQLFDALLASVPMAFQRSVQYRAIWNKVSALRRRVYMLAPDIADEEQALHRLRPPLRDSEWALYAVASCRTALLNSAVYLQRCDGQGYVSIGSQRERAVLSGIDIKAHLLRGAREVAELRPWGAEIRRSLASAYFDQSYFYFQNGRRFPAYRALFHALRSRPAASYLKFGLRMLLPRGRVSD